MFLSYSYVVYRKTNLMHNLLLTYFVNLYMFRAYLGPSSRGKLYVYNSWYLSFFLDNCLVSWLTKYVYTKSNLCIKLVFLYTIISRCTVKKT